MPMKVAGLIGGHRQLQRAGIGQAHVLAGKAHHAAGPRRAGPLRPPASGPASIPPRPGRSCAWTCAGRRSGCSAPRPSCRTAGICCEMHCSSISMRHRAWRPPSLLAVEHRPSPASTGRCARRRWQSCAIMPSSSSGDDCTSVLAEAAGVLQRPLAAAPVRSSVGQGVQHKHLAAGQQRAVDLKGGVLRGGADQNDAALFHKGQKGVLLGLVEAVNLVHKDDACCSPYSAGSPRRCCITARISWMPLVTAEKSMNFAFVRLAMMRASVVLPTPGGPQKIMEERWSPSIRRAKHLAGSPAGVAGPQIRPGVLGPKPGGQRLHGLRGGQKTFCCSMGSLLRKARKISCPSIIVSPGKKRKCPKL